MSARVLSSVITCHSGITEVSACPVREETSAALGWAFALVPSRDGATIVGWVDARSESATCDFEISPSADYDIETFCLLTAPMSGMRILLKSLRPTTTYCYSAVATCRGGTTVVHASFQTTEHGVPAAAACEAGS